MNFNLGDELNPEKENESVVVSSLNDFWLFILK